MENINITSLVKNITLVIVLILYLVMDTTSIITPYIILHTIYTFLFCTLQINTPCNDTRRYRYLQTAINTMAGVLICSHGAVSLGIVFIFCTLAIELGYYKGRECFKQNSSEGEK